MRFDYFSHELFFFEFYKIVSVVFSIIPVCWYVYLGK